MSVTPKKRGQSSSWLLPNALGTLVCSGVLLGVFATQKRSWSRKKIQRLFVGSKACKRRDEEQAGTGELLDCDADPTDRSHPCRVLRNRAGLLQESRRGRNGKPLYHRLAQSNPGVSGEKSGLAASQGGSQRT